MKFEIYSQKGANSIEFGMTPDQIRSIMGEDFTLFKRVGDIDDNDGRHPADYYAQDGVFFYYDPDGHLEAIEFTRSAVPTISGVNFFELPMNDAAAMLRRMDSGLEFKFGSARSRRLGLALWTSADWEEGQQETWDDDEDWEPEEAKVESILIAPSSYFDDY